MPIKVFDHTAVTVSLATVVDLGSSQQIIDSLTVNDTGVFGVFAMSADATQSTAINTGAIIQGSQIGTLNVSGVGGLPENARITQIRIRVPFSASIHMTAISTITINAMTPRGPDLVFIYTNALVSLEGPDISYDYAYSVTDSADFIWDVSGLGVDPSYITFSELLLLGRKVIPFDYIDSAYSGPMFAVEGNGESLTVQLNLILVGGSGGNESHLDFNLQYTGGFEFEVTYYEGVDITSALPIRHSVFGGSFINLAGIGFAENVQVFITGDNKLEDAEIELEVTWVSSTSLLIIELPPHTAGWVDIRVVNPDIEGATDTLIDGFQYSSLMLFAVVPMQAGILGGDIVRLDGVDFDNQMQIFVDEVKVASDKISYRVGFDNKQHVFIELLPHAAGLVNVRVQNPDTDDVPGEFATLVNGLTFTAQISTPGADAGGPDTAKGPIPAKVKTKDAKSTRGQNNGTLTYAWTADASNPAATSFTAPDQLITEIIFPTYAPGTYRFVLTVTDEGGSFHASSTRIIVVPEATKPRIRMNSLSLSLGE